MRLETARLVLDRAYEGGVRGTIYTGGGEPTLWEQLPEMIRYAAKLGMDNGLYSNGIQFGEPRDLAAAVLHPANNLVFARISVNYRNPATGRRFSVATPEDIESQYEGLRTLYQTRDELYSAYGTLNKRVPAIDVSVICDEHNVGDLSNIFERVAEVFAESSRMCAPANSTIVDRPLTKHLRPNYSMRDHESPVINTILQVCGAGGSGRALLERVGFRVDLGFGLQRIDNGEISTYDELIQEEYSSRDCCWALGMFLTVGPDATVHLCCDRNCYGNWAIGNLRDQSVAQVYHSARRRRLLERIHMHRCGPEVCEPTCRTVRLNRIARAIMSGELTCSDIDAMRLHSTNSHRLLLG